MNDAATQAALMEVPPLRPEDMPPPDEELIADDGVPMDTFWHRCAMNLLIEVAYWHNRGRTDFYVGGNMFIYYSAQQARNRDYRGPDFFFVWGVDGTIKRQYWAVWNEGGKYPDLIIELLSPTTAHNDLTVKKDLYEKVFQTRDYFCYDPETQQLRGWRLREGKYDELTPNKDGRLWCEELGLWLGTWTGPYICYHDTWLRFFDDQGRVVPNPAEAAQADLEGVRKRAEAAEAEAARLKALLIEKESTTRSN